MNALSKPTTEFCKILFCRAPKHNRFAAQPYRINTAHLYVQRTNSKDGIEKEMEERKATLVGSEDIDRGGVVKNLRDSRGPMLINLYTPSC